MTLQDALAINSIEVFWNWLYVQKTFEPKGTNRAHIHVSSMDMKSLEATCFHEILQSKEKREEFCDYIREKGFIIIVDNLTLGMASDEVDLTFIKITKENREK